MNPSDVPFPTPSSTVREFPWQTLYGVNLRCIELLVHAARSERPDTLPLVRELRDQFRNTDPESRQRASERGALLVDIAFQDEDWWHGVKVDPVRKRRTIGSLGFARRTAVPLARAALTLAWYGIQEDAETATVVLGMSRGVTEVIAQLQLPEIDRLAECRYRQLLPRWHDQPDYWRDLLEGSRSSAPASERRLNLRAVQMVVGEQLSLRTASR